LAVGSNYAPGGSSQLARAGVGYSDFDRIGCHAGGTRLVAQRKRLGQLDPSNRCGALAFFHPAGISADVEHVIPSEVHAVANQNAHDEIPHKGHDEDKQDQSGPCAPNVAQPSIIRVRPVGSGIEVAGTVQARPHDSGQGVSVYGVDVPLYRNNQPMGYDFQMRSEREYELAAKLQAKEAELAKTKQDYLEQRASKNKAEEQLAAKRAEIEKQERLKHIRAAVEPAAQELLLRDDGFEKQFSCSSCLAYVMSVDIRKSTDLMLKAVEPAQFVKFIRTLCDRLRAAVLRNHGIFDKFTGDGILAFFPEFFSGEEAGFLAVTAATQCHRAFAETYDEHLDCFTTARQDVGLGIGIDYGTVALVSDLGGLTVVGTPVVYACRFGGAPAGTTLLNRQAYSKLLEGYSAYCSFRRTTLGIKNEGDFIAYQVELNEKPYIPKSPPWLQ
jgi:class 3 adenylate cyclase